MTDTGWVQMTLDTQRAGSGLLNFAVDDLAKFVSGMRSRGIKVSETENVNMGVQLTPIADLDGNIITFIGDFRENY